MSWIPSSFYTFQRRQRLTDEGEVFLKKAVRVINEYDSITESAHPNKGCYQGQIFIGFPPIAGICYMSELIVEFSRQYPGIKINILEKGSQRIMEEVESGALDLGCVSAPVAEDRFDHAPLSTMSSAWPSAVSIGWQVVPLSPFQN